MTALLRVALAVVLVSWCACGDATSGAVDAAPDSQLDAGPFVCGNATCDESSQYCYEVLAGVVRAVPDVGCNSLPASCSDTPTCACIEATIEQSACASSTLTCTEDGARVSVACNLP